MWVSAGSQPCEQAPVRGHPAQEIRNRQAPHAADPQSFRAAMEHRGLRLGPVLAERPRRLHIRATVSGSEVHTPADGGDRASLADGWKIGEKRTAMCAWGRRPAGSNEPNHGSGRKPALPSRASSFAGAGRDPLKMTTQNQTPFVLNLRRADTVRSRLGDRREARSGSQAARAKTDKRVAYSGPTFRPLPARGAIAWRIAGRRERRQIPTRCRLGSSSSSGRSGSRFRSTENSRAKPSVSASTQLSTARTGTRRLIRGDGFPPPSLRINSGGHEASWSRSRRMSQFR